MSVVVRREGRRWGLAARCSGYEMTKEVTGVDFSDGDCRDGAEVEGIGS